MDLSEVKELIVAQGRAWDEFNVRNSERLSAIESEIMGMKRPNLGGGSLGGGADRKSLNIAMRRAALGDDSGIKALSAGSDPGGGYLVLPTMDSVVRQIRDGVSPLSALVRNIDLESGGEALLPYFVDTLDSGWVAEHVSRDETDTLDAGEHRIALHELYANPKISQKLLDTATYDVGAILTDQIAHGLAQAEAEALHNGNGVGKPRGFTTYTTAATADSARTFGVIEHIPTGASGAFGTDKADVLIKAVDALAPRYRQNARWLMNRATMGAIRRIKESSTDAYMLQPNLQLGAPETLLGYPVVVSDNVPSIAADSLSVWFGDWQQAYCTVRMPGMRLLRDPYSSKGQVYFFAYQRVGGGLIDSNAIKCVKFANT